MITVIAHDHSRPVSTEKASVMEVSITFLLDVPSLVPADLRRAWATDFAGETMREARDVVDWKLDTVRPVEIDNPHREGSAWI